MSPVPSPSSYVLHPATPRILRAASEHLALLVDARVVSAGLPSPADDHEERPLDLHEFLVKRPAATFIVRVAGESMRDAGDGDGDLVVIDRSVSPRDGDVVVACVGGELTIKRLRRGGARAWLEAANPDFAPIEVNLEAYFAIEGVVLWSIHRQSRHGAEG